MIFRCRQLGTSMNQLVWIFFLESTFENSCISLQVFYSTLTWLHTKIPMGRQGRQDSQKPVMLISFHCQFDKFFLSLVLSVWLPFDKLGDPQDFVCWIYVLILSWSDLHRGNYHIHVGFLYFCQSVCLLLRPENGYFRQSKILCWVNVYCHQKHLTQQGKIQTIPLTSCNLQAWYEPYLEKPTHNRKFRWLPRYIIYNISQGACWFHTEVCHTRLTVGHRTTYTYIMYYITLYIIIPFSHEALIFQRYKSVGRQRSHLFLDNNFN